MLQLALAGQVEEQLQHFSQAVRRKQRLLRGDDRSPRGLEGPQQQLAKALQSVGPVSVLCCGAGVVLPMLSLQVAASIFYAAANLKEIRETDARLPLRLVAAEPLTGAFAVTQKLLSLNAKVRLAVVSLCLCAPLGLSVPLDSSSICPS